MTFSIGADPEVFVGTNGKFKSAHNLVKGTKLEPTRVNEGSLQVDGMALEYNIDPCYSRKEFVNRIKLLQTQVKVAAGALEILPVSCVEFTEEEVADVPVQNFELGCSVDFDAYSCLPNDSPNQTANMRTAGGHVHIGEFPTKKLYTADHLGKCRRLVKLMDREVGVYSLLWDPDVRRRTMYGKAGCYRPTFFGVEYRSMSNLWTFNEDLIGFVYDRTERAYEMFLEGMSEDSTYYQDVINHSVFNADVFEDDTSKLVRAMIND